MHLDPATGGMRPNTSFVAQVRAHFSEDEKLVLTCKSGGRSARAAALLVEAGFQSLVDQRAGWSGECSLTGQIVTPGWISAGLPVSQGDGGERGYAALSSGETRTA
jgi:rhodanese-related sulfurtransferase